MSDKLPTGESPSAGSCRWRQGMDFGSPERPNFALPRLGCEQRASYRVVAKNLHASDLRVGGAA